MILDGPPFEMGNFLKIRIINLNCNANIEVHVAKLMSPITVFTILHVGIVTIIITSNKLSEARGEQATHEY